MQELSIYTQTELLKFINDLKTKHEVLKSEIIDLTLKFDELIKTTYQLSDTINEKIKMVGDIEKEYIVLIEEISNR